MSLTEKEAATFSVGERVAVQTGRVLTPCTILEIVPPVVINGQVRKAEQAIVVFDGRATRTPRYTSSLVRMS